MPELLAPDRASPVELVEITKANLRDYLRLKAAPAQEHLVAPVAVSIAQAHFHPEAWFRGIAAGGTAVGFEPTGEVSEGEHVMKLAF